GSPLIIEFEITALQSDPDIKGRDPFEGMSDSEDKKFRRVVCKDDECRSGKINHLLQPDLGFPKCIKFKYYQQAGSNRKDGWIIVRGKRRSIPGEPHFKSRHSGIAKEDYIVANSSSRFLAVVFSLIIGFAVGWFLHVPSPPPPPPPTPTPMPITPSPGPPKATPIPVPTAAAMVNHT